MWHRDTSTGGAEVSLSWNMFKLEHAKPAVSIRITKNRIDNNWKLWCGESDLDGRKHFGIFSFNFWITVNLVTGNKWLAE